VGEEVTSLIQIGEVVQGPGFEEPAPLPELQDAVLTPDQLAALVADYEAHVRIGEVILKGAATARAMTTNPSLGEAMAALRSGAVRGVQVRYIHDGREWWDTLMVTPAGVRLVRIER